jgi:hypothetical protein
MYWLPLYSKTGEISSPPHPDNESQQSINNDWSCILENLSGDWMETLIEKVQAVLRSKRESDKPPDTG